jgi:hypothetical protein
MKKLYTFLAVVLTLSMFTVARAQEVPDTLGSSYELDEVVVEGRTQRVVKDGVEYIPGNKVKKSAMDAFSLLFNMQIPQLSVSPIDKTIKTAAGNGTSLFIDYKPTSSEELQGLRPEDILRVEVLDYPQDPRFNGELHVVNFIMRKYEWGGYTKLTASGSVLNTESVSGAVYEKFNYKQWTFDASASASGGWDKKYSNNICEVYRDFLYNGTRYDEVNRTSSTDDYYSKRNRQQVSLRADWANNTSFIRHSASFSRSAAPEARSNMAVRFSDNLFPSTEAIDIDRSQSISFALNGYYQFVLPKGNTLNVDWTFSHSGNNQNSDYRLGDLPSIINGNKERTYYPALTMFYAKNLGHNNTLRAMASSYATFYRTEYSGTFNETQKLTSSESMLFLEYMHYWGFGLSLYSRVGASYVFSRLNGVDIMHEWNPRLGIQLQYQINSKNIASVDAWWANSSPQAFTANNAIVQDNELLWIQGNPDLKNIYGPMLNASYSFIPTNNFSMMASLGYTKYNNIFVYTYDIKPGYNGVVRTFSDDHKEHQLSGLLSASLRLFNNSLALTAYGKVNREIYTGVHPMNETILYGVAQASYFVRNFSFTLYYASREKRIFNTQGYLKRRPQTYGLNATYALGEFKANLSFNNWFGPAYAHAQFSSAHYSSDQSILASGFDRGLSLTLSYTFSYGKKVNRNDEVTNSATKKSAILE